jgi:cytochrome bd-type quinol oxidase subunit 1
VRGGRFTAFLLEATFFGVMLLGRDRASPWFYFFSCCMVALGTMLSSFWILANNSWMQVPLGMATSPYHLPVPSALWRSGADQTAAQKRRLRVRRRAPTQGLIRQLAGMDE